MNKYYEDMPHIAIEDCKQGDVYLACGRIGMDVPVICVDIKGTNKEGEEVSTKYFLYIREKFGGSYVDMQCHWDYGAGFPGAVVKPIYTIGTTDVLDKYGEITFSLMRDHPSFTQEVRGVLDSYEKSEFKSIKEFLSCLEHKATKKKSGA